jgi:hypothetical protein
MQPSELAARARPVYWIGASAIILLVDYVTGPFIQFPILFVLPVAIATGAQGLLAGVSVATLLPLLRLSFFLRWKVPVSWQLECIDTLVDVVILGALAGMVHQIIRQQRQIRVLEGMLPICSFCKRIRDEAGEWRRFEVFITERSEARFSHTFCQQCGREHYPELVE